jgi:hypothetical protein
VASLAVVVVVWDGIAGTGGTGVGPPIETTGGVCACCCGAIGVVWPPPTDGNGTGAAGVVYGSGVVAAPDPMSAMSFGVELVWAVGLQADIRKAPSTTTWTARIIRILK